MATQERIMRSPYSLPGLPFYFNSMAPLRHVVVTAHAISEQFFSSVIIKSKPRR